MSRYVGLGKNLEVDRSGAGRAGLLALDKSPVTKADLQSSSFICDSLSSAFNLPILSEENIIDYDIRKNWKEYWLVDPLDGTKDFLTKNGEFTVNIALVKNRVPVLGVIYAPAIDDCWWSSKGKGSYKNGDKILNSSKRKKLIGLDSRHHQSEQTTKFFKNNHISSDYLIVAFTIAINFVYISLYLCIVLNPLQLSLVFCVVDLPKFNSVEIRTIFFISNCRYHI